MLVEVAVPVPLFQTFTYKLPEEFLILTHIGCRVIVPFGKRTFTGIIISFIESSSIPKLKSVLDVLDESPAISPRMIKFANWLSEYYLSPIGETLKTMLPQGMSNESSQLIQLNDINYYDVIQELRKSAPRQSAIITALTDHKEGIQLSSLRKAVGSNNLTTQLKSLEEKGYINISSFTKKLIKPKTCLAIKLNDSFLLNEEKLKILLNDLDLKAPKQADIMLALLYQLDKNKTEHILASNILSITNASESALKGLLNKKAIEIYEIEISREDVISLDSYENLKVNSLPIIPNSEQKILIDEINNSIDSDIYKCFLLHGVTGSGKTIVYIEAIKNCIKNKKTALMLVPEIALTMQLVERFTLIFGNRVVVMHSRMSEGERYDGWRRVNENGCDLVIGARSALFAPLKNLGLIIVDEEHESSFKQYDQQPRYQARDAAVVRGSIEGTVVILGSATPSVESYFNALNGKYKLIELNQRADKATEPKMIIVDIAKARKENKMIGALSDKLIELIKQKKIKNEGVILFQNRRGFATRIECSNCSHSPMCPNCAVALTYHKTKDELHCHYCNYQRIVEKSCTICGSKDLKQPGVGTQKVEEELLEKIADIKVLRMDLDTTSKKGSHKKILDDFAIGNADVLLGTQMVTKGLDFNRVSLVGVVSADSSLMIPDFRSSERTYQLITQVAGRAGRRSGLEADVIIQTSQPENPAIQSSFTKDYLSMFHYEIQNRKELRYPPFSRFIVIEIRSEDKTLAEGHSEIFKKLLPSKDLSMEILGPSPALIWKLRSMYRFQIIVKNIKIIDPSGKKFMKIFTSAYDTYMKRFAKKDVQIIIDVDAQGI